MAIDDLLRRIFENDILEFLEGRRKLADDEFGKWAPTYSISEYILTKHRLGDVQSKYFSQTYTQHIAKNLEERKKLFGKTVREAVNEGIFDPSDETLQPIEDWNKLYKYRSKYPKNR
jgi:hypothetical protein